MFRGALVSSVKDGDWGDIRTTLGTDRLWVQCSIIDSKIMLYNVVATG